MEEGTGGDILMKQELSTPSVERSQSGDPTVPESGPTTTDTSGTVQGKSDIFFRKHA